MSNGVDFRKLALDLRAQLTTAQSELARVQKIGDNYFTLYADSARELAALREELAIIKDECIDHVNLHKAWTKQRDGLQQRLTAAEQRNAELVELLDSAFFRLDTFIEAEREMPVPSMEVLRDAILRHCPTLKPVEPGPIQVDCGECPNITDGCHGSCMKAKPTESGASNERTKTTT